MVVDTGLAAHLAATSQSRLSRQPALLGPLLENFVLGELARQLTWSSTRGELFHYRTRDRVEVDGLLEAADGRIIGIEVKATSTVRPDDFRPINHLAGKIPDRFHLGLVMHTGTSALSFGPRLWAIPIDRLWRWTA